MKREIDITSNNNSKGKIAIKNNSITGREGNRDK